MIWYFTFIVFVFGLCVGSFINAFEYRIHAKKDFVKDRSECPSCGHKLSWRDLVPVLSWVLLNGKCRYCGKKISPQYPIVELLTGFAFALYVFLTCQNFILPCSLGVQELLDFALILFDLFFIGSLVFFTVYDFKYGYILDKILFPVIAVTLGRNLLVFVLQSLDIVSVDFNFFQSILAGAVAFALFFLIIFLSKGKGMGGGDMKFGLWMGILLGWPGILYSLYSAFIIGGIVGAIVLLLKLKKLGQSIPFGPLLALGTYLVIVFEEQISYLWNMFLFPL